MRTLFTIALLCLLLLAVSSSVPRPARATYWVDLFLDCASNYADAGHSCEGSYAVGPLRTSCLDTAGSNYQQCLTPMYYPTAEPDYCDQARADYAACGSLFDGIETTTLVMQCRMDSGIDRCE